jgi:flagellin-like hook-associated protein FlgL
LVTASAYRAADDFFFGNGEVPKRVDLTPPATATTATGVVNGTTADTVFWYKGGDSADPRRSVTAKVGEGATVAYGVEGTEKGLVNLVRALGAMSIQTFPKSDPFATDRYNAMTSRNNQRLSEDVASTKGSIEMIAVELGLAQATTGAVAERHTAHKAQLSNMLQDIEEAPTEVVAMEILALKTRLEASYQTTAMLSQLALVNYLK